MLDRLRAFISADLLVSTPLLPIRFKPNVNDLDSHYPFCGILWVARCYRADLSTS